MWIHRESAVVAALILEVSNLHWLVVEPPHFSICSAAPSWCLVFVHVAADLLSASAVVIWLYYGSVVAALFKIRGEVLRQAVHNVQVLPLCCRLEQCFPEYLVEAIWIYLGFCGMKGAVKLSAYQGHMRARWVIAAPRAASPEQSVPHTWQPEEQEGCGFFPQRTYRALIEAYD